MEFDIPVRVRRHRRRQVAPPPRPLRNLDVDVPTGVIGHRLVQAQPHHGDVPRHPVVFQHRAVPPGRAGLGVGGPDITPAIRLIACRAASSTAAFHCAPGRGAWCCTRRGASSRNAARAHRISDDRGRAGQGTRPGVGPLGHHQLTEHQCMASPKTARWWSRSGEQVAHAGVDGEPVGAELPDQLIGSVLPDRTRSAKPAARRDRLSPTPPDLRRAVHLCRRDGYRPWMPL